MALYNMEQYTTVPFGQEDDFLAQINNMSDEELGAYLAEAVGDITDPIDQHQHVMTPLHSTGQAAALQTPQQLMGNAHFPGFDIQPAPFSFGEWNTTLPIARSLDDVFLTESMLLRGDDMAPFNTMSASISPVIITPPSEGRSQQGLLAMNESSGLFGELEDLFPAGIFIPEPILDSQQADAFSLLPGLALPQFDLPATQVPTVPALTPAPAITLPHRPARRAQTTASQRAAAAAGVAVAGPSQPARGRGRPRLAEEDKATPYMLHCLHCRTFPDYSGPYKSGEGLRKHMAMVHNLIAPGEEVFLCEKCPHKFQRASDLRRHNRTAGPCTVERDMWYALPQTRTDLADHFALPRFGPMDNALIGGREQIPGRSMPSNRTYTAAV